MKRPVKAGKPPKPPKARKPPKAAKAARGAQAKTEGAWVTAEGYRFAERLAALDPARAGGDRVVALANEVLDQHVRFGRRGLAILGPARGTGVTFVATNLAIALAQAGVSTLLVDSNLSDPRLQELIAPPEPATGLQQLLGDPDLALLDVVRHDVLPGLSLLYAGPGDGEGDDGLIGDRFRALATECLRDFDCTIFDTPAANRSAGALAVAVSVGYALVVARRGASFAEDVETLIAQLAREEVYVVGSVLNRA
jgi:Mrp family chromosome partitioning ATPase